MVNLSRIPIFRMVHIDNISHILQYGLTHWSSPNCNPNYIPIGDKYSKSNYYQKWGNSRTIFAFLFLGKNANVVCYSKRT